MSEKEKWTEEDQMVLVVLAASGSGEAVEFDEADIEACKRAARILSHMIGAEVPPGEGDAD